MARRPFQGEFEGPRRDRGILEMGRKTTEREKITDKREIEKKLREARTMFNHFLQGKLGRTSPAKRGNIQFFYDYEPLVIWLGLSDLSVPADTLKKQIDEIVLAAPGFAKTETGYKVADPALLFERFSLSATKKAILAMFDVAGKKEITGAGIMNELGISAVITNQRLKELLAGGKITISRTEGAGPKARRFFKLRQE